MPKLDHYWPLAFAEWHHELLNDAVPRVLQPETYQSCRMFMISVLGRGESRQYRSRLPCVEAACLCDVPLEHARRIEMKNPLLNGLHKPCIHMFGWHSLPDFCADTPAAGSAAVWMVGPVLSRSRSRPASGSLLDRSCDRAAFAVPGARV